MLIEREPSPCDRACPNSCLCYHFGKDKDFESANPDEDRGLMLATSGQTLSHYRLLEQIGKGGMGVVWKAEDTILGRTVAIKILPADSARDEKRRRMFFNEARLASSLSEAHIAQVYEFGQEGDLEFIVMEHVEGKPLGKLLQGRPLSPEKVSDIGVQIAQALSNAHRKSLLHRDLKPSNILVTPEGEVKVVDFGLAMLFAPLDGALDTNAETLSMPNLPGALRDASKTAGPAGTLPYMSPEQVRGEKLDSRSDIFSMGVVLYEMATGQRPFLGSTPGDLARDITRCKPMPIHELLPKVPLELERIIQKTLAAKVSERYQTMQDLAVDLKRLGRDLESGSSPSYEELTRKAVAAKPRWARAWAFGAGLVLLGIGLVGWQRGWWKNLLHVTDKDTVLILPFEVLGQEEGRDYLGRAFAEAIAINLAQARKLQVLPVPSPGEVHSDKTLARTRAAVAVGAGRLLTGSLQRHGKSIEASLSLVDTVGNRILWGTQGEAEDGSLTSLAASFAHRALAELAVKAKELYDYPRNFTGTPAMAASTEFMEAMGAIRHYEHRRALAATQRLVELFPAEAMAHALRAYELFRARGLLVVRPGDVDNELKVLERLDPANATAKNLRCEILLNDDQQFDEAVRCASELLNRDDLTPAARAWALRDLAAARMQKNDAAGALRDIREAAPLDPTNQFTFTVLSDILQKTGDLEGAATSLRQALALVPENRYALWDLSEVLQKQGKPGEAVPFAARLCEQFPSMGNCAYEAIVVLRAGHRSEALSVAGKAAALEDDDGGGSYTLAVFRALAGDTREALRLLQKLVAATSPEQLSDLGSTPDFESLHGVPEFEAFVTKINKQIEARKAPKTP